MKQVVGNEAARLGFRCRRELTVVWRRGRDLNPRGVDPHRLSRPAPYQARRPRHLWERWVPWFEKHVLGGV